MATLNFPDDPTTGDVYTDGNSGFSYEWNGTVWISTDPSTASNIREIDNISGDFDGSDTTFTLKVAGVNVEPANVQQLIISVGGVMQNAGQDFTLSGSTLTFTTAPTSGLTFFGVLLGTALSLNTVADGSVGRSSLSTTTNYLMGGLTVDQSAGIVTAYQFKGDGSQLTGVASTDNIVTSTDARFNANVSIAGSLTVQGTTTTLNVDELNVQDKTVGIASTNAPSSLSQDGAGAIIYGQTHVNILYDRDKAALGINTGVSISGFLTATSFSGALASWNLGADGSNHYTFDGPGLTGAENDPTIYLQRGKRYNFVNSMGAHPFRIQSDPNGSTGTAYNDGITNNDVSSGTLEWDVQFDAPNVLYYQCTSHGNMGGKIYIGNSGDSAIIGTGVTINNTGIDAGNAGIVTAGTVAAPSNMSFQAGGTARLEVDSTGRVSINEVGTYNDAAEYLLVKDASTACNVSIVGSNDAHSSLNMGDEDDFNIQKIKSDHTDNSLQFFTNDGERLRITSGGGFSFNNAQLVERVEITAGKLSGNQDIDLADGMVHYFTTQETTTATPNIRIDGSTTLNSAMDAGDVITVTLITTAAAAGYSANLTIDGVAVTEEWVGGSAPSEGSADGLDIYTYTIICIHATNTGDSGFKVIANLTNATN